MAHAKWGGEWRMPTVDEMNELLTKCTWMWTTSPSMNDIHGYKVTGPNGETLFFPAVGCYSGTSVTNKDVSAYFWTSACNTDNQYAHALCLYEKQCAGYPEFLVRQALSSAPSVREMR